MEEVKRKHELRGKRTDSEGSEVRVGRRSEVDRAVLASQKSEPAASISGVTQDLKLSVREVKRGDP